MIVQCSQCQTRFRIPDEKVTDRGVKVRCTRCQHTFRVSREGAEAGPGGPEAPGALAGGPAGLTPVPPPAGLLTPPPARGLPRPPAVLSSPTPVPRPPPVSAGPHLTPAPRAAGASGARGDAALSRPPAASRSLTPAPLPGLGGPDPFATVHAPAGGSRGPALHESEDAAAERFGAPPPGLPPSMPPPGLEEAAALVERLDAPAPAPTPSASPPAVRFSPALAPSAAHPSTHPSGARAAGRTGGPGRAYLVNGLLAAVLLAATALVAFAATHEGALPLRAAGAPAPARGGETHGVANGLYDTRSGRPVFFVRGEAEHRGEGASRVQVRVEILDGTQRLRTAVGLAGAVPSPEELHALATLEDGEALRRRLDAGARVLAPGERAPFLLVFVEYPPELGRYRLEVTAEPAAGGGAHATTD